MPPVSLRVRICDVDACNNWLQYFCKSCRLGLCYHCFSAHLRFNFSHDVVRYRDINKSTFHLCSLHSLKCDLFCRDCRVYLCYKAYHLHRFHRTTDLIHKMNRLHAQTSLLFYKVMPLYSRMFTRHEWNLLHNETLFTALKKDIKSKIEHGSGCCSEEQQNSDCEHCKTFMHWILKAESLEKEFRSTIAKQMVVLKRKQHFISNVISHNIGILCDLDDLRDLSKPFLKDIGRALDFMYIDLQFPYLETVPSAKIGGEPQLSLVCDPPIKVPVTGIFEDKKFTMLSTFVHQERLSDVACTNGEFAWICGPDHATFYKVDKKGRILTRISVNVYPIYICANDNIIFYSDYTDNSVKLHYIETEDVFENEEITYTTTQKTIYTNNKNWCPMALTISMTPPKDHVILLCEFNALIGHGRVCKYNTLTDEILQIIEYIEDLNSIPLYSSVWSITENTNGDIWVVDGSKYSVILVDANGRFLSVYTGQAKDHGFYPWGVTHNSLGQILISDHYNFKIHIVDTQGNFLRFLYMHYTDLPTGISCGPDNKLWIVGNNGKVNIFVYM